MNDLSIARRYARALSEQAKSQGITAEVDEDFALLAATLRDSRELVRVFESPIVPRHKKKAIVRSLFESRVQPVTLHFMELLVDKNREAIFPMVTRAYSELRDQESGVVAAHARVARELPADETREMQERIEAMTGKKVRLEIGIDEDLLGGAIVRIGDTVYDGSVRNKLGALHSQMRQGSFNQN
jgi:F-type H+-transporting ATPase subunit delta